MPQTIAIRTVIQYIGIERFPIKEETGQSHTTKKELPIGLMYAQCMQEMPCLQ